MKYLSSRPTLRRTKRNDEGGGTRRQSRCALAYENLPGNLIKPLSPVALLGVAALKHISVHFHS
jgi:hypothetical protein